MDAILVRGGGPLNGTIPIAAAKNAGIYKLFDGIYSVESVGVFKPHPSVYQFAVDELRVAPNDISFQSSNGWDAHGAGAFGFTVAWGNLPPLLGV